jgi:biopolymer transport protein ExbD
VYVDDKEDIFLNNNPVTREKLAEEVGELVQAQTDKSVVLRADSSAHHGLIITIMDGLRKRGIYKIVVSTVKPLN